MTIGVSALHQTRSAKSGMKLAKEKGVLIAIQTASATRPGPGDLHTYIPPPGFPRASRPSWASTPGADSRGAIPNIPETEESLHEAHSFDGRSCPRPSSLRDAVRIRS